MPEAGCLATSRRPNSLLGQIPHNACRINGVGRLRFQRESSAGRLLPACAVHTIWRFWARFIFRALRFAYLRKSERTTYWRVSPRVINITGTKVGSVILQQLRILDAQCLVADRLVADAVAQSPCGTGN